MDSLGQGYFAMVPIVLKPDKAQKKDVIIDNNVSDVVTGGERIEKIKFISVMMTFLFK